MYATAHDSSHRTSLNQRTFFPWHAAAAYMHARHGTSAYPQSCIGILINQHGNSLPSHYHCVCFHLAISISADIADKKLPKLESHVRFLVLWRSHGSNFASRIQNPANGQWFVGPAGVRISLVGPGASSLPERDVIREWTR